VKKVMALAAAVFLAAGLSTASAGARQGEVAEDWAYRTVYPQDRTLEAGQYEVDWISVLNRYRKDPAVKQLICVRYCGDTRAVVQLFKKKHGAWTTVLECPAVVGRAGIGKEKEGDAKTPAGEFSVPTAFGILPDPGTGLPYIRVDKDIVESGRPETYNQIVDLKKDKLEYGDESEFMFDYSPQYNYGLVIGYNMEGVYPKGSGIFMHCRGVDPYTSGCVAVSEENMRTILKNIGEGVKIIIGRSRHT